MNGIFDLMEPNIVVEAEYVDANGDTVDLIHKELDTLHQLTLFVQTVQAGVSLRNEQAHAVWKLRRELPSDSRPTYEQYCETIHTITWNATYRGREFDPVSLG